MFDDSEDEEIMAKIEASGKKQAEAAAAVRTRGLAAVSPETKKAQVPPRLTEWRGDNSLE